MMAAFATVVGLLLTTFTGIIAYFQWRTSHQRVVLDLFDRRLAVFGEIEESVRDGVNKNEVTKPFWRFVLAERQARFLFGSDVLERLESVRSDFAAVHTLGTLRQIMLRLALVVRFSLSWSSFN